MIELLIVIAIIGILAVAFLPMLLNAPAKARDMRRMQDVKKIANFFIDYYVNTGSLPDFFGCMSPTSLPGVIIQDNISDFGGVFPTDPGGDVLEPCPEPGEEEYYGFLKLSNFSPDSKYAFVIASPVEDVKNGNFYLPSGPNIDLIDFIDGVPGVALMDEGYYYLYFVDK